jgi:DNA primase
VEDLTRKEVFKALRNKVTAEQALNEIFERSELPSSLVKEESSEESPQPQSAAKNLPPHPKPQPPPVSTSQESSKGGGKKDKEKPKERTKDKDKEKPQPPKESREPEELEQFKEVIDKLPGTLDAYILDKDRNVKLKVSVRDLVDAMRYTEDVDAVVFDGVITQRLVDIAAERSVRYLVGVKAGNITKKPLNLKVLSFKDVISDWQSSE